MKEMKKVFGPPIETYEYGDYFVDFVIATTDLEVVFESWLYNKKYAVKMLIYAMPAKQLSYEYYKECVEADIDDYIEMYKENYEKEYFESLCE